MEYKIIEINNKFQVVKIDKKSVMFRVWKSIFKPAIFDRLEEAREFAKNRQKGFKIHDI
jgi:c-di-GMP-related signal transduction protein